MFKLSDAWHRRHRLRHKINELVLALRGNVEAHQCAIQAGDIERLEELFKLDPALAQSESG